MNFPLIYSIRYSPGPNWLIEENISKQPYIKHHAVYIQELYDAGKVILAGPFKDQTGGECIIHVESEEDAMRILDNDPIIKHRTAIGDMRPWAAIFNRLDDRSPNYTNDHIDKLSTITDHH